MKRALFVSVVLLASVALTACRTSPGTDPNEQAPQGNGAPQAAAKPNPASEHLRFMPAPAGDVATIVQAEVSRAKTEGRRLVVYEGATWCEPCQHFHAAAAKGELDSAFPHLTLLEFDADRDRDRLVTAGYNTQYIPLFALPGKDGRAAGPKTAGGIKGDGVVSYLTNKLQALLSQGT